MCLVMGPEGDSGNIRKLKDALAKKETVNGELNKSYTIEMIRYE